MLLMVGVAGSGKSTQCKMLQDAINLKWLSVGSLIREKSPQELISAINEGELLDDSKVEAMLVDELKDLDLSKLVIDGFPRRLSQAIWLEDYLLKSGAKIDAIINLNLDTKITRNRLINRGRQDDNPAAIESRLLEYEKEIKTIINRFSENGVLVLQFNADKSPEDLNNEIKSELKRIGVIQ